MCLTMCTNTLVLTKMQFKLKFTSKLEGRGKSATLDKH